MYHKMVVLLDGSKLAEVVFTYAQELSARLNINLELLHVCDPREEDQLPMHQAYMDHMAEVLQKNIAGICSKIGSKTSVQKIKTQGKVVVGYPPEEILKYTEENNIDLIMLSTHGRSGISIWDLGNVTHKVIHASKVPIWMVPSELREEILCDTLPKKTIVIPLDGSKLSEAVIPHAINIAKQRGVETELVLIHVEDPNLNFADVLPRNDLKRRLSFSLDKKKYLDETVKRIEKEGIKARGELLKGYRAQAIINFVKNNPAQLIAMTTHGHAALTSMIFGSVTENILHLVKKTPIFLVKP
jgi:nucleotide-binding universal stress UspA family protein